MGNIFSSCCCTEDNGILSSMVFFSYAELKRLGRTPRCPQDKSYQTHYRNIQRDQSLFIYYSHGWLRGWPGAKDYNVVVDPLTEPKPHPDTPNQDKFQLLLKACEWIKKIYGPDIDDENIYIWFDYGCIDQDAVISNEWKILHKIIGVCDIILTTIYDDNWTREWQDRLNANGTRDLFHEYGSPAWNQGDHSYLKRAWCLVEMMYASSIALTTSSPSRVSMFRGILPSFIEQNRRPHLLMGTNELELNKPPIVLPPRRSVYFEENDPRNGKITVEGDRVIISELVDLIDDQVYVGERNANNQRHGKGTYTSSGGNVYQGEWKDNKIHGKGTYTFADGDIFNGEWKNGQKHGKGTYKFADGEIYEGDFENNKRHGKGMYRKSDGSIAHNGDWRDGKPVGKSYPKDQNGWITKKGHVYPSWNKRYFTLRYGTLEYYADVSCREESLKGRINVTGYTVDTSTPLQIYISSGSNRRSSISIGSSANVAKDLYMRFENETDKEQWSKALRDSV